MNTFNTKVLTEGSKGGPRITVPLAVANALRAQGWQSPGWLRMHVKGFDPVFVYGRFYACRPSVAITMVNYAFPTVQIGDLITVALEPAESLRATGNQGPLDWLPLVEPMYFPTQEGSDLLLWSRYEEPFRLKREADPDSFWWLLGMYQAEGSKSEQAPDWTLAGANPALVAAVPVAVEALGIQRSRQFMEILHAPGERPGDAEKAFQAVCLRISATRLRSGVGGHAAVLHIQNSKPLLRLFKAMLARVFSADWTWPTRTSAKQYAFGWLDGDGSINIHRKTLGLELRLAGYETEQIVVLEALKHYFIWDLPHTAFGTPIGSTNRTLRLDQAAELAAAGIFPFSLNRARLLWGLSRRLSLQGTRSRNYQGRSLTSPLHYFAAQKIFEAHLQEEAAWLDTLSLAKDGFNTSIKCASYPKKENAPSPK